MRRCAPQGKNIDTKTWWLVRDNMRGQAYNMKANMLALNGVLPAEKKEAAKKAYSKFWAEINAYALPRALSPCGRCQGLV